MLNMLKKTEKTRAVYGLK